MAIQRLTYLDVPKQQRSKQAANVQHQLRAILSNPASNAEQREFAKKQIGVLKHWVNGSLPTEVTGELNYHHLVEILTIE